MIKNRLKVLIKLATSDGAIHPKEKKLIHRLGRINGLTEKEVNELIADPGNDIINLNRLSNEDKFEHLFNLIQLMKVDGEVFDEEIIYCQGITKRLGFDLSHLMEMYPHIYPNMVDREKKIELRKKAMSYLEDKNDK